MDLFGRVLHQLPLFKQSGIQVVMDFSVFFNDTEYQALGYFPYVDYAFCSYNQHDRYIEEFMREAKSMGPKVVTVTLGENGSIVYDGQQFYKYGILPVQLVNTVGAGDAYIAGFMYGVMSGWSIPKCMAQGAKMSSDVIAKFEPY